MKTKNNLDAKNQSMLAVFACLLAATMWGVLWYPLRVLDSMGLPGLWAILAIYIPAAIVVLPKALLLRNRWPDHKILLWLLALAAGWTNLSFMLALLDGTVVRVLLLFYLSPVWTVVLSKLFLNETISKTAYLHLTIALTGAVILLWTDEFDFAFAKADWLAISSGFGFALTNVLVRKIGNIPIVLKMSSAFVGVIMLSVMGLLMSSSSFPMPGYQAILLSLVLGIMGMVLMTYAAQFAVTHLPIYQSATLFLFEVPAGAISAALLSHEVMTIQEWIGGFLVLLAAWLSARTTIKHSRSTHN